MRITYHGGDATNQYTRTVDCVATATCEGAVSYDLSGERLTERGLSGRPHPAPGAKNPPSLRRSEVYPLVFRQYYRDPVTFRSPAASAPDYPPSPLPLAGLLGLAPNMPAHKTSE